jgi:hypothetical protein
LPRQINTLRQPSREASAYTVVNAVSVSAV